MAVAIDKISTMTLPNYSGLGAAIEGLTAKQAALVLSTRNLSEAELEEVVIQNDLITKYGAEELVKTGLLSANSVLLASEKAINAEKLKETLVEKGANEERAKSLIQKHLQTISNGEETTSVVMLNKALMEEAIERGIITKEKADEILSTLGVVTADNLEIASKKGLAVATWELVKANTAWLVTTPAGWATLFIGAIAGIALAMKKYSDSIEENKQKIKEAAKEAKSAINDIKSNYESLSSTTNDIKKKYAELAQEVENLGKINQSRGRLSNEDYEEFLDLSNQLAKLFPQLTAGYDDNGNAILNLSGNVDTIVGSLNNLVEVQQKLANQEIIEKMPTVWSGYITELSDFDKELESAERKVSQHLKWMDDVRDHSTITLHSEEYNNLLREAARQAGIMSSDYGNDFYKISRMASEAGSSFLSATWDFSKLSEEEYEQLLNKLAELSKKYQDTVQLAKGNISAANADMSNYINTWLSSEWNYSKMDSDLQNVVKDVLLNTNWADALPSDVNSNDWSEVSNWLQRKFLYAINDINSEEIENVLVDAFNDSLSSESLKEIIGQLTGGEFGFTEDNPLIIYLHAKLTEKEDIRNSLRNSLNQISTYDSIYTDYEELSYLEEYTKDFTQAQADLWLQVTEGAENATDAINRYEEALESVSTEDVPSLFTQLNNSKESLDKFQSSVKSAYDAYATLLSGNYSSNELLDSIQAINQAMSDIGKDIQWESMYGGGIGLAQVNEEIERNLRKYAEEILRNAGITDAKFAEILTDSIIQAQKATAEFSAMNTQLDNLQASYRTLTDAIEYYNETGFINLDTLQSLLTADENLIKMLEVENGQLVINQEAYEELVAVQLLEFKEKLDNAAAAEIEALALSKAEEATNNNAQASEDAVAKLDAETEAFKRNTEAASENAITKAMANAKDAGISDEEIQNILDKYDEVWNAAINNYHKDFPTFMLGRDKSGSGSGSGSSSSAKDFEETFDWIETAIDRIERSISNLDLKASSVYRSWSERNSNLKAELLDVKKEMDIQSSGYNRYMQQAASVGLSEEWASKVRNGQIDINSITDKALAERIKEYENWYKKALECQDAVESLRESVSKLYETAFDNIVSQFDSIVSVIENSKSLLDEQINQAEERGYIANVAYYEALINVEQKNIEQLTKERTSLQSALADAVSNGAIAEGSQEWADMQSKIDDVTLSIEQANTAMIKYGNSIRDIQWQIFDLIQDRISRISSESDFLINLLSYDKQYDDRGQLTDTGMSTVGLHGMNYNVYMAQADKYTEEMLRIDKELAEDPYNQTLYERRQELLELQQEMIIAAEDEKQAIVDMVEEGINREIESLQSLIDAYAEALDSQKSLYDYSIKMSDLTKEQASLQKMLSAYENDLSEESKQKIQQIKVRLEKNAQEIEQNEYEKFINDSKKLLDDLMLEYSEALNQRLDNIDALIADMIASSNANAGMISDTLSSKADSVGYYLSESMEDIWNTNTGSMLDALAMYDSNIMGGFAEVNTSVGEVIRGVTETVSGIGKVDTTINNAINSVTGNMQAILDKLSAISTMQSSSAASSYYGGSGGTGTSSSGSSGTGSSGSGSSGSSGSGGSGFFIYKNDSYQKGNLNIQTSIIDRLKYHDFDSSFSARSSYYNKMGFSGTYTGTDSQNIQMLNWMKLNGYKNGVYNLKRDEWAWTQEGGKAEVILNPDGSITRPDGSVLTPLKQGDSVLSADATKNLYSFMNNPQAFVRSMGLSNIPVPQNTRQNTISNDIQLTIELPNVQNYEQFKYALQHDKQFEKVVQAMTTERAAGGSSLKKYNI